MTASALCGRTPDVFSSRALWSGFAERIFHAVALAQHVNALAVDGALVKEILVAPFALDEPEPFFRSQRFDCSCHSSSSALWARCCSPTPDPPPCCPEAQSTDRTLYPPGRPSGQ